MDTNNSRNTLVRFLSRLMDNSVHDWLAEVSTCAQEGSLEILQEIIVDMKEALAAWGNALEFVSRGLTEAACVQLKIARIKARSWGDDSWESEAVSRLELFVTGENLDERRKLLKEILAEESERVNVRPEWLRSSETRQQLEKIRAKAKRADHSPTKDISAPDTTKEQESSSSEEVEVKMYDFEDGNGPVPAHQHPNGCGWVANTAFVAPYAYVGHRARVFGRARVLDRASLYDNARVYGDAIVKDRARVRNNAKVCGDAVVYEDAYIRGNAVVSGDAWVRGHAQVYEDATVFGSAYVYEYAWIYGKAKVYGNADVCGSTFVYGTAELFDDSVYEDEKVFA